MLAYTGYDQKTKTIFANISIKNLVKLVKRMGSCFSNPNPTKRVRVQNVSSPQDTYPMFPVQRGDTRANAIRTEGVELNKQTLEEAFLLMAQYITQQHRQITIIALGGAVNVMLLQVRRSCPDVAFFGASLENNEPLLVNNAARYAGQNNPISLGDEWFNNQTMLSLPPDVRTTVTQEAIQQDEVVFERPGLKILAAPWNYAMCSKVNRLVLHDHVQQHDLSDAVAYLHYYIQGHDRVPVTIATVKGWCQTYQKQTNDQVIKAVNKEYRRRYGANGIIM